MRLPIEHHQEQRHREILKTLPFQKRYAPYELVQDAKACLPLFGRVAPSACRRKLSIHLSGGKHFLVHHLPRTTLLIEPPAEAPLNPRTPALLLEFDALPEFPLDILPKPGLTLVSFLGLPQKKTKSLHHPKENPPFHYHVAPTESSLSLVCLKQPSPQELGGFLCLAFEICSLNFTP